MWVCAAAVVVACVTTPTACATITNVCAAHMLVCMSAALSCCKAFFFFGHKLVCPADHVSGVTPSPVAVPCGCHGIELNSSMRWCGCLFSRVVSHTPLLKPRPRTGHVPVRLPVPRLCVVPIRGVLLLGSLLHFDCPSCPAAPLHSGASNCTVLAAACLTTLVLQQRHQLL
jgi:hypothetical protein